jgi:DNA-binding CsgD family transcriptional regulator
MTTRGLTSRERQVMAMVALGRSNTEIAGFLGMSPETVKRRIGNARAKLDAADRVSAAVYADRGWRALRGTQPRRYGGYHRRPRPIRGARPEPLGLLP